MYAILHLTNEICLIDSVLRLIFFVTVEAEPGFEHCQPARLTPPLWHCEPVVVPAETQLCFVIQRLIGQLIQTLGTTHCSAKNECCHLSETDGADFCSLITHVVLCVHLE